MKRYKIFTLILLVAGMSTFSSWGKLEPEDYSEINPSIFPKTEADIQALVLSCYYPLRGDWWDGILSGTGRGIQNINDCTCGILTGSYGIQKKMSQMNYYPDTEKLTWFYYTSSSSYASNGYANKVSRCTSVLYQIENSSLSDELKNKYEAEVRCARAFMSYLLYDMYGTLVVAPIEAINNPLEEKPLPRLTTAEMVKFIDDDLDFAVKYLPSPSATEYGKFSKGLANMLKIRLYLHETPNDKSYFNKVETIAREMMKSDYGYELQSDYNAMFDRGGQGAANKELIWAIPCAYNGPCHNQWHVEVLPTDFSGHGMPVGFGDFCSTWYFYNTFEEKDLRKERLLTSYTTTEGVVCTKENPGSSNLDIGPIPLKIGYDSGVAGSGGYTDIDLVIFRYADVYLSLAEALVEKTGASAADFQEAIGYINKIRERAGLEDLTYANYNTAEKLLDAILMERYHEFWCENGQYRADLIRYHRLVPLVKAITQSPYAAQYKELYPLPLQVISDGKGVVLQNPGY